MQIVSADLLAPGRILYVRARDGSGDRSIWITAVERSPAIVPGWMASTLDEIGCAAWTITDEKGATWYVGVAGGPRASSEPVRRPGVIFASFFSGCVFVRNATGKDIVLVTQVFTFQRFEPVHVGPALMPGVPTTSRVRILRGGDVIADLAPRLAADVEGVFVGLGEHDREVVLTVRGDPRLVNVALAEALRGLDGVITPKARGLFVPLTAGDRLDLEQRGPSLLTSAGGMTLELTPLAVG